MSFCCSNKGVTAKENAPLDKNHGEQEPCVTLDAVTALGGLGCAESSNVCTPSAFHITLKCIKHIRQAAKGNKASECISQEGHLQSGAVVMRFLQEMAPFPSFAFTFLLT